MLELLRVHGGWMGEKAPGLMALKGDNAPVFSLIRIIS
jgi:hypothetical protein